MLTEISMKIERFSRQYQQGVEDLVLSIQSNELGTNINKDEQPDLIDVEEFFLRDKGNFWVALDDGRVIGTIGLEDIGNQQFALRKMFVDRNYRGKEKGVAQSLLTCAFAWCRQHHASQIFLSTIDKCSAAHRFYEKNQFVQISKSDLPQSYLACHVDTIFYQFDCVA